MFSNSNKNNAILEAVIAVFTILISTILLMAKFSVKSFFIWIEDIQKKWFVVENFKRILHHFKNTEDCKCYNNKAVADGVKMKY